MFGIGYQEMFVVLVVALVIFGPGRLPELAGQLGRYVRDFRRMTADLTGEFERTIAEVDDVKQTVRKEVRSMRAEVEGVSKSVKDDLGELAETKGVSGGAAKKPAAAKGAAGRTATKTATVKPATARAPVAAQGSAEPLPVATKADPLADVSLLDDEPVVKPSGGPIAPSTNGTAAPSNGKAPKPAPVVVPTAVVGGDAERKADGELAGVAPGGGDEALARARRRRAAAGYNRRS